MGTQTTIIPQQVNVDGVTIQNVGGTISTKFKPYISDFDFYYEDLTDTTQNNTSYILYKTIDNSGNNINQYLVDFRFNFNAGVSHNSHNIKVKYYYSDSTTYETEDISVVYTGNMSLSNIYQCPPDDYTKKIDKIEIYAHRTIGTSNTMTISNVIANFSNTYSYETVQTAYQEVIDSTAVSTSSTSYTTAKTYNFATGSVIGLIKIKSSSINPSNRGSIKLTYMDIFNTSKTIEITTITHNPTTYFTLNRYSKYPIKSLKIEYKTSNAAYLYSLDEVVYYKNEVTNNMYLYTYDN